MRKSAVYAGLFGLCVGDALGVPVEFYSRKELRKDPVIDMRGFGTHSQPPGTWSDDSSLSFSLADSLCTEYNIASIAQGMVDWGQKNTWTPHGVIFDIGITTRNAIGRLAAKTSYLESGGRGLYDNGNGSLMRILPLAYCLRYLPKEERYKRIAEVSSITHAHRVSVIACIIYVEFALQLLAGNSLKCSYDFIRHQMPIDLDQEVSLSSFARVLSTDISIYSEDDIESTGYVIHTLEAALWCLLTTSSYSECVLKVVNLGGDTDTTATVAGGLAGLYYGYEDIPSEWVQSLARLGDVKNLCDRLEDAYCI